MPLSKSQLERIAEIIARHFNAFTFEALGPRALTDVELQTLKDAGILREGVRHMVMDPVVLGRITALLPMSARRAVTYDSVLEAVSRVPMTEVERHAIDFATAHAGEHIRGIRDLMIRDAKAITARASGAALRAVQEEVADSIRNRTTIGELKTRLFDSIDDRDRDWKRIAHTEINTAIQQGVYRAIRDASDEKHNQLVFKRPNPDACKHCKRLYLMPDGVTPRVFRLADLADSNVGLRAADWEPVIGSMHPWCNCQLQVVPEGFDFVRTRTVTEPFEFEGREWKRGEIVDPGLYDKLDQRLKNHIGIESVLAYTGTTATLSVEKSLAPDFDDADCTCEHD